MSVSKALQCLGKTDLECRMCRNRFFQPKILECTHTYCLHCIQEEVETYSEMQCVECLEIYVLTQEDCERLTSNTMISQLLEYVTETEDQKPPTCSFCDNQPAYHCPTCQLYLCKAQCFKYHEKIPASKDHLLYTLNEKKGSSDKITKCAYHRETTLDVYCFICKKIACEHCCSSRAHKIIYVKEFNGDVTRVLKLAQRIQKEYKAKFYSINGKLTLCRKEIEINKQNIEKLMEESKKLKETKADYDRQVEDIGSKLTKVTNMITSVNIIMSRPEETKALTAHKETISFLGTGFDIPGTFPCKKPDCTICLHINRSSCSITGPNMMVFSVEQTFTCEETNVVYIITCAKCPNGVYIGETGRTFKVRMEEHIRSTNSRDTSVGRHFFSGHTKLDLRVAVLTKIEDGTKRKLEEKRLISYFNSINMGLNLKL